MSAASLRRHALAAMVVVCGCGRTDPLRGAPASAPPDVSVSCPAPGRVEGRVCATDGTTWLNGAAVSVDAIDCAGNATKVTATSGADGTFELSGVPPGVWPLTVATGAFASTQTVTVEPGELTLLPVGVCVVQGPVKIAVVTGTGDRIEKLLDQLDLQYTLVRGDESNWLGEAAPFFADLATLEQFDLIFVDCAAAHGASSLIDFGPSAAQIEANLAAFVDHGGSLYASDWALLFSAYAAPGSFNFSLQNAGAASDPVDTRQLMGFAPQTLTAQVKDSGLAGFLGKDSLTIVFPNSAGAVTNHWGLIDSVADAQVLVQADGVEWCSDDSCAHSGGARDAVPLAVLRKVGPTGRKGGNVVYTSFHNIAQPGEDVAQLLKYLVLNL